MPPRIGKLPKKVLTALPPGLLEQIDFVAEVEHRNRSELIREACRRYIDEFRRNHTPPRPEVQVQKEFVLETAEERFTRIKAEQSQTLQEA